MNRRANGKRPSVLLTDHPWPDLDIEKQIFLDAGIRFVAGPSTAGNEQQIEQLVADANPNAILTCWAPVSITAVNSPTSLRIVARLGIGLDNIAVEQALTRGAWVSNVPDYCTTEVADHAIALMLAHFRGVVSLDRGIRVNGWNNPEKSGRRISSLCVGLVGFGRIGRATAERLKPFGCRLLATSRSLRDGDGLVEAVELSHLIDQADAIILQLPLTKETSNLVDSTFLKKCRRHPLLINVGRGGLIDNDALIRALDEGLIAGAALDVVAGEPSPPAALLSRSDVIFTPHIAYRSAESLVELRERGCRDVVRALAGQPPLNPCGTPHGL